MLCVLMAIRCNAHPTCYLGKPMTKGHFFPLLTETVKNNNKLDLI